MIKLHPSPVLDFLLNVDQIFLNKCRALIDDKLFFLRDLKEFTFENIPLGPLGVKSWDLCIL